MSKFAVKCQHCDFKDDMEKMAGCFSWQHKGEQKFYCLKHRPNDLIPLSYPGIPLTHKCLDCLNKEKAVQDAQEAREEANRRWS